MFSFLFSHFFICVQNPSFVDLRETVVPPAFEGQGIGKVLAKAAFEHCANNNLKMKLTCWYLDRLLKQHPDEKYSKLIVK